MTNTTKTKDKIADTERYVMEILLESSPSIKDPILDELVDKTTSLLKLGILQSIQRSANPAVFKLKHKPLVVGGAVQKKYQSVGSVAAKRFDKLPSEKRQDIINSLGTANILTPQLKQFGGSRAVEMRSSKYVSDQINVKAEFKFINGKTVNEKFIKRILNLPAKIQPPAGLPIVANKGLKFLVNSVKCIDETDPEFFGSDKIDMGGVAVDDKGTETKINAFHVADFDDGENKRYSPPRVTKDFALDSTYPKDFFVFLDLAEKDSGGFSAFLHELYQAIKAELLVILSALGAAAGAAIGAAIGGSVGTAVGGPIGTIIGIAAGMILGALVAWLASAFRDDMFEPQVARLSLPSANSTFANGSLISPVMAFDYRDHGGHYRVQYSWQIVR